MCFISVLGEVFPQIKDNIDGRYGQNNMVKILSSFHYEIHQLNELLSYSYIINKYYVDVHSIFIGK